MRLFINLNPNAKIYKFEKKYLCFIEGHNLFIDRSQT